MIGAPLATSALRACIRLSLFLPLRVFFIFFLCFLADRSMDAALAECAAAPQACAGAMAGGSSSSAAAMAITRNRMTFTPVF